MKAPAAFWYRIITKLREENDFIHAKGHRDFIFMTKIVDFHISHLLKRLSTCFNLIKKKEPPRTPAKSML